MLTLKTEHMTRNELHDAVIKASPGETLVYATGDLGGDRQNSKKREPQNYHAINQTAELALELAGYRCKPNIGLVFIRDERKGFLTQKKIGPSQHQYRLTKAS